jgi:hypothetical protein
VELGAEVAREQEKLEELESKVQASERSRDEAMAALQELRTKEKTLREELEQKQGGGRGGEGKDGKRKRKRVLRTKSEVEQMVYNALAKEKMRSLVWACRKVREREKERKRERARARVCACVPRAHTRTHLCRAMVSDTRARTGRRSAQPYS